MDRRGYSTARIHDTFTNLAVSRQRKYQLRNEQRGLCIICAAPAFEETLFCYECNIKRGIQHPGRNKRKRQDLGLDGLSIN